MIYGWAMKLIVKKGYYKFYPDFVGEIKLWENKNGVKLYPERDFWTFSQLKDIPNYSFTGHLLTGLNIATSNYTGLPEDVLDKNKLTYNVSLGTITPRLLVNIQRLNYSNGAFMSCKQLPQIYALDDLLRIVTGFEAFIDVKLNMYKFERLFYEDI